MPPKFWLISSFIFLFFLPVHPVTAAEDFRTTYHVVSRLDESGTSRINLVITLTNLASGIYPASYQLVLKGSPPVNLSGTDADGPLAITVKQPSPDLSQINIVFNHIAAGRGQQQTFTLNYIGDPARKVGQVWQYVLPRFTSLLPEDAVGYDLYVPLALGKTAYMYPLPTSVSREDSPGFTHFTFSSPDGLSAAFGNFQSSSFTVSYHLPARPVSHTLYFPPDTTDQKVFYDSISPPPDTLTVDRQGNWSAVYTGPQTVTATGLVHLLSSSSRLSLFAATLSAALTVTPDIKLTDSPYRDYTNRPLHFTWLSPWQFFPMSTNTLTLRLFNPNGTAVYNTFLNISVPPYHRTLVVIPPFSYSTIPVIFPARLFPPLSGVYVSLQSASQNITYNMPQSLFTLWYVLLILITSSLLIAMAAAAAWAGDLYIQRHKR